jgi:TatD DNase family protein
LRILKKHPVSAAIFHGFTGSPEQAARITGDGYYLSFGERTFRSSKTIEALGRTSTDRLFLETDENDVSIVEVYQKAAQILNMPVGDLQQQIMNNYQKIFK